MSATCYYMWRTNLNVVVLLVLNSSQSAALGAFLTKSALQRGGLWACFSLANICLLDLFTKLAIREGQWF